MHAGYDLSTIVKSVSSYESDKYREEEIEEEYELKENFNDNNSVSDQMEVDDNQEDNNWSIIKIHNLAYEK